MNNIIRKLKPYNGFVAILPGRNINAEKLKRFSISYNFTSAFFTFKNIEKKEKLQIFKYILQKNEERTVIVVSKDPDIMQLTDRIITLDDGKVVDTQIVNKK